MSALTVCFFAVLKLRKTDTSLCESVLFLFREQPSQAAYQFLNVARSNVLIWMLIFDWIFLLHVSMCREQRLFTSYTSGLLGLVRLTDISKKNFCKERYLLYGKPANPGENSNGWFIPVEIFRKKRNTFRGITFFPFLPKRPKFSVPFVWITRARLQVERKRKIYRYFVNGTTQSHSCFRCPKKWQYHLTEIFFPKFPFK